MGYEIVLCSYQRAYSPYKLSAGWIVYTILTSSISSAAIFVINVHSLHGFKTWNLYFYHDL